MVNKVLFTIAKTGKQSINRGIGKEDEVHLYTMDYYSATEKNEIMPCAATWMDPEIIKLSKVSQTHAYTLICGI